VAALCNGTVINFTNVANDAQVPRTTVYEYFEILKDTLIIHEIPAWTSSRKRKPLVSSKYFFFDVGVASALQGRLIKPRSPEFGMGLEALLAHELTSYRDYVQNDTISFWRSASGFEVDFILGDHTAIEVKAKETISPGDLRSLKALADEKRFKRLICVSLERARRTVDGIEIVPVQQFLEDLWAKKFAS